MSFFYDLEPTPTRSDIVVIRGWEYLVLTRTRSNLKDDGCVILTVQRTEGDYRNVLVLVHTEDDGPNWWMGEDNELVTLQACGATRWLVVHS